MISFDIFFFNDTATTEIYTLSLHDALPISALVLALVLSLGSSFELLAQPPQHRHKSKKRSEEHTSELQSRLHLVCRLLLEKKKNIITIHVCSEHISIPTNLRARRDDIHI